MKIDSQDGLTALHLASFIGNAAIIDLLLANGADPHVQTYSGEQMLHMAAQGDAAYSIFFFKDLGHDINCQDSLGRTPLHWACLKASYVAFQYLMPSNDLDVDA